MALAWTEAFSSFVPAGTGWQNYDLYTNKSVPKGAIAHIVIGSVNDAAARTVGVRTDGSSLSRYVKLHEGEAGGAVCFSAYVKCDSSTGLIETYCDSTTGITCYLMGYWTGVDYTEAFTQITTSSGSAWTDSDLYTNQSVPKGAVADMLLTNFADAAATTVGVRTDGSSLTRSLSLHEAESSSVEYTDCTTAEMMVKVDASTGLIEYYVSSTTYGKIYLLGYFSSAMTYTERMDTGSVSATGWTDWDMTSYHDVDGRVCDIYCANAATSTEYNFGARINGSSLSRYLLVHESESNGQNGYTVPTGTDASGILEIYASNASYEYFRHLGYYWDNVATSQITLYSDATLKGPVQVTKTSDATLTRAVGTVNDNVLTTDNGNVGHHHTFYTHGRHWAFWADYWAIYYSSSTDGITWASRADAVASNTEPLYGASFAFHYDGRYVHLIYRKENAVFCYRRGMPNVDGTITWDTVAETTLSGSSSIGQCLSVCTNTDGNVFVVFPDITNSYALNVFKNANTDGTWSNASGFPYVLTATPGATASAVLIPLASGNIVAIYGVSGATLKQKTWTESSDTWSSETAASTTNVLLVNYGFKGFSAVASPDTGEVHLAFYDSSYNIKYRRRNSSGTWQTEESVITASNEQLPSLAFDETNNDLYLFIYNTNATGAVSYKKRSSTGTWDSSWTDLVTGMTSLKNGGINTVSYDCYGKHLGVLFFTETSSPFKVKYQYISFGAQPVITKTSDAELFSDITKYINLTSDADLKGPVQITKTSDATLRWPQAYVKYHNISASSGAGTNYQVKIRVCAGTGSSSGDTVYMPCRSDFADIRFLDSTGAPIDSWCEEVSGTTYSDWWVEVREDLSTMGKTIWIECGGDYRYPFGNDQSEMDATFIFADHFYGTTINATKWPNGSKSETPSGSILTTDPTNSTDYYETGTNIPIGTAIRVRWKNPDRGFTTALSHISVGYSGPISSKQHAVLGIWQALEAGGQYLLGYGRRGSSGSNYATWVGLNGGGTGTSRGVPFTDYYIDEIRRTSSLCRWILQNGTTYSDESDTTHYPSGDSTVSITAYNAGTMSAYEAIDFLLVRKYIASEPAHGSWGPLQIRYGIYKQSDAVLTSLGAHQITKTADATLKGPVQISKASDARLKQLAIQVTKTSDSRLKLVSQITKSSDGDLKGPVQVSKLSDARLKKLAIQVMKTSDARLKSVGIQVTKLSDARLKKTGTQITKTSDGRLKVVGTQLSKTSDGRLKLAGVQLTMASDGRLKGVLQISKSSDARLTPAPIYKTSDARLKSVGLEITKTSDGRLKAVGLMITKQSDARLKKSEIQIMVVSDARLRPSPITKASDARLKQTEIQATKTSDARLKSVGVQITKTSDAVIGTTAVTRQIFLSSDARLKVLGLEISKTSDGRLLLSSSVNLLSDARLKLTGAQVSKTADARLKQTDIQITKASDAILSGQTAVFLTSDARLVRPSAISLPSDATLFGPVQITLRSDAVIRIETLSYQLRGVVPAPGISGRQSESPGLYGQSNEGTDMTGTTGPDPLQGRQPNKYSLRGLKK